MADSGDGDQSAASDVLLPTSPVATPVARVAAWIAEDRAGESGDWESLKTELDKDRLSSRKLFPE